MEEAEYASEISKDDIYIFEFYPSKPNGLKRFKTFFKPGLIF